VQCALGWGRLRKSSFRAICVLQTNTCRYFYSRHSASGITTHTRHPMCKLSYERNIKFRSTISTALNKYMLAHTFIAERRRLNVSNKRADFPIARHDISVQDAYVPPHFFDGLLLFFTIVIAQLLATATKAPRIDAKRISLLLCPHFWDNKCNPKMTLRESAIFVVHQQHFCFVVMFSRAVKN